MYSVVSPIARIHGSRNQEVEMVVALFTIIPSIQVTQVWLPVLTTLCSAGLEILDLKKGIELKVNIATQPF